MSVPKWLKILIVVLLFAIAGLLIASSSYSMRVYQAKSFANKENKYIQSELQKGERVEKVVAIAQAAITEKHAENTDFEFTTYTINVNTENRTTQIDFEVAYGKHFKKFSTKQLKY